MNTNFSRLRNAAFCWQIVGFAAMFFMLGPLFDIPCVIFGAAGSVVLLLTIKLGEPIIQKLFFILAGGAGTGSLITLVVFNLLRWSGHTPRGDGGGITVAMLIVACPILFLIGAAGSIVFFIKGRTAEKRNIS